MPRFRYPATGDWFKGNTHVHSKASDGGKTVEELSAMYAAEGYGFLFITDHWVASHFEGASGGKRPLLIDGVELDGADDKGSYYHVVCLGPVSGGVDKSAGFAKALEKARGEGCVLILAHPSWTGNTEAEVLRHKFHAVEVHNTICHWLNGKGSGSAQWDALLSVDPSVTGLAADDAHITVEHPTWNGGWIWARAPRLGREEILASIRSGAFYASMGPRIRSIEANGRAVRLTCTPARHIRLVGQKWKGQRRFSDEGTLKEAEFTVPEDYAYARIEIEDSAGRLAWTNSLFVED